MATKAKSKGVTVKDVDAAKFVMAYAQHLKRGGKIKLPDWVEYVKGATWKELAPLDDDWYYIRLASMARKTYIRGGKGVGAFRKIYGGAGNRGTRPSHFEVYSGKITRHACQTLESLKVLEKDPSGGRRITKEGRRDLDLIAGRVAAGN